MNKITPRLLFSVLLCCLCFFQAFSDEPVKPIKASKVTKLSKETEKQFIARITEAEIAKTIDYERLTQLHIVEAAAKAELTKPVDYEQYNQIAHTKKLVKEKNVLIGFTGNNENIDLNLFVPTKGDEYSWLQIEACECEGGAPTIRSFFYANADSNSDLEIGVICGWDSPHRGAECQMTDEVRFFKLPKDLSNGALTAITDKKFEAFYRKEYPKGVKDYQCTVNNFSNAADVKKLLSKIGYSQKP